MGNGRTWRIEYGILVVLVAMLVVPFVNKPPHIDEESYLFIGERIQDHLARPYDWWRAWQPSYGPEAQAFIYAHPPLFLWIVSILGQVFSFDAIPMLRLSMLPFGVLLILSFYGLARRLTANPGLATAAFLLSPAVLLVLHQSLMIDLPYVALSCAAVWSLYESKVRRSEGLQWIGGGLLGLAALTKYPSLALVPLAFGIAESGGSASRKRISWRFLAGVAIPFLGWQAYTAYAYGAMHLSFVLQHAGSIERSPLFSRLVGNLAHLGWTQFAPPVLLLYLLPGQGRLRRVVTGIMVSVSVVVLMRASLDVSLSGDSSGWRALADDLAGQAPGSPALLVLAGLAIFLGTLSLSGFRARQGPDRFLTLWAGLTLASALFGHNFASGRYLVPTAIPLHLLMWRRLAGQQSIVSGPHAPMGREGQLAWAATLIGGCLSLRLAVADYEWASVYPEIGDNVRAAVADQRSKTGVSQVWFSGEWGFRYQMEKLGYRYLPPGKRPESGSLVIVPRAACPGDLSGLGEATLVSTKRFGALWLRTMAPGEGIAYYSEVFGLLPYGPRAGPAEEIRIWRAE